LGFVAQLVPVASFFVGETVTKLIKAPINPGGADTLIYTTVLGKVGTFVPFLNMADTNFFGNLELQMRVENPPLAGRDQLAFRSYFFPSQVRPSLQNIARVQQN